LIWRPDPKIIFSKKEDEKMKSSLTKRVVLVISILLLSGVAGTNNVALAQGSKTFNNPTIENQWGQTLILLIISDQRDRITEKEETMMISSKVFLKV